MGMNNMINGAAGTDIRDSKGAEGAGPPRSRQCPPYLSASADNGVANPLAREGLPPPRLLLATIADRGQLAVAQCR